MKAKHLFWAFLALITIASPVISEETNGWSFWDDEGRAFAPLKADQREAQFRMNFMKNYESGQTVWDLAFGGDLGLLQHRSEDQLWTLTVRGLVSTRFEFFSESFNQMNSDYIGGLALARKCKSWSQEWLYYHQSSHLGDEVMALGRTRIDYSRETFRWLISHQGQQLRPYGGFSFIPRAEPKHLQNNVWFQAGLEWKSKKTPFFFATDLQSRQEHHWFINHSLVVGLEMGSARKTKNRQRLQLEYYHGYSHMGQYIGEKENNLSLGIGFNF